MQQIMASHASQRSANAPRTASIWASRKSMVTMTMSPLAIAAEGAHPAPPGRGPTRSPHALTQTSAGTCLESASAARDHAPLTWLSRVTSTTRRGWSVLATEVRFRFIQRLDINHGKPLLHEQSARYFCRAFPRTKNGIFLNSFSADTAHATAPGSGDDHGRHIVWLLRTATTLRRRGGKAPRRR